jgi:hypothetical protein
MPGITGEVVAPLEADDDSGGDGLGATTAEGKKGAWAGLRLAPGRPLVVAARREGARAPPIPARAEAAMAAQCSGEELRRGFGWVGEDQRRERRG